MKVAFWSTLTAPTSASSTATSSLSCARSSATENSVTACSEAATALPGSTVRLSTTPLMGERIEALDRLVSVVARAARDSVTAARAAASMATARSTAALALSSSVAEGTLPPERRATSSKRASVARDSFTVALA